MYGIEEFPHGRNWDSDLRQIIELFVKLKDLPEQWEKFQEDMHEDFDNLEQGIKDMFADYQQAMEHAWLSYQRLMDSRWTEYQTNLNQAWADYQILVDKNQKLFENDMTKKWVDYQTQMSNDFATFLAESKAEWQAWQTIHESLWQAYKNITDSEITALQNTVGGFDSRIAMAEGKVADVVGWCKWLDYMVEIAYVWTFDNGSVDIPEGTAKFNVHLRDFPDTVKRGVYYLQFASLVRDNGGAWEESITTDIIVPVYEQFPVGIEQRLIGHVPIFDQNAKTVGTILIYVYAKFSNNIIKDDYQISVQVLTVPGYTRINNRQWGIRLENMCLLGVGMTYNGMAIPPYNPIV